MAVKSLLNPGSIVSERRIQPAKLENFITGGSPLGESVISSAANKIVGFQRGAAGVAARPPDLGSIINTLSSSVLNNVENRVQSINQNITQVVGDRLGFYDKELKGRLDKTESAKPSGILANFLKLYKDAIGYIQFLGNRKNIKTLGENIKELQKVFTETFEVAKVIRQAIVRIVKQLSNLPTASPSGGGLNLDIDIPGGPLKRSLPRGLANFGKMALAGGAVAGAGMLGSRVVSGMLDVGGEVAPTPVENVGSQISAPLLDRFSGILERFSAAIDGLIRGSSKPSGSAAAPKSSGGKPTSGGGAAGGPGGGGDGGTAQDVTSDTAEEKAWLSMIRGAEGTAGAGGYGKVFGGKVVKELEEGKLTIEEAAKMSETGKLPDRLGGKQIAYGSYKGRISGATGAYQFMPGSLRSAARSAKIDLNTPMTPEIQDKLALAWLIANGVDPKKAATESSIRASGQSWGWAGIHGEATGQTSRTVRQSLESYNKDYAKFKGQVKPGVGGPELTEQDIADIKAGRKKIEDIQTISQTVAQQPGANQPSRPLMVPLNLSGGQQTQPSAPPPPAPPPVINPTGTNIRNVSSTNFDNFYTIHSRLTFNIVE